MKAVITADLHLNKHNRFQDFLKSLTQIENYIEIKQPDYYIIAGDVFHNNNPTLIEIIAFANHIGNVRSNVKKDILICIGNHDTISKTLTGLDWLKPFGIKVKQSFSFIDDIRFKFFIGHGAVAEAKVDNQKIKLSKVSYLDIAERYEADIIILGHIHTWQVLCTKPLVLIPGSIEKVSFAEKNDDKYIWYLDSAKYKEAISDKDPGKDYEFLQRELLQTRKMLDIIYDLDFKKVTINKEIVDIQPKLDVKDAIVKITIIGKKEIVRKLDYDKLYAKLEGAYKVLPFNLKYTDGDLTAETKENILEVKPDKEILSNYCIENKVSDIVSKFCNKIIK